MSVYIVSALILCAVSVFLVFHCEYEDGIFGRLFLIVLAITNGITVWEWILAGERITYDLLPATIANQAAMAGFIARHCYRFIRWRTRGDYQWRPARK